jgi:hypothetical protein
MLLFCALDTPVAYGPSSAAVVGGSLLTSLGGNSKT